MIKKLFFVLIILVSTALLVAWKLFCPLLNPLPSPTGQYAVGVVKDHWQSADLSYKPAERNAFNVEIFYPSSLDKQEVQSQPYNPEKLAALQKVMAKDSRIKTFFWGCLLEGITMYAQPNAPLLKGKFPILLYLPGIGSEDGHNLYVEELASHGYIIVAIEPPYDILASMFPDNKLIALDPVLEKGVQENNREVIYQYRDEAHERWSSYVDVAFAKLKELNADQNSPFYQLLDLAHVGVFGHSHGGAVALDFCQKNPHICKAGIDMDGWTKTYNRTSAFQVPFMLMLSEDMDIPALQELTANNRRSDFKKVVIKGARHGAFNDGIMSRWPLVLWTAVTTRSAQEVRKEISKELVTFFDTYLS